MAVSINWESFLWWVCLPTVWVYVAIPDFLETLNTGPAQTSDGKSWRTSGPCPGGKSCTSAGITTVRVHEPECSVYTENHTYKLSQDRSCIHLQILVAPKKKAETPKQHRKLIQYFEPFGARYHLQHRRRSWPMAASSPRPRNYFTGRSEPGLPVGLANYC